MNHGTAYYKRLKDVSDEKEYYIERIREYQLEIEQDAWGRGARCLFLFNVKEEIYKKIERDALLTYENPPREYLELKLALYSGELTSCPRLKRKS